MPEIQTDPTDSIIDQFKQREDWAEVLQASNRILDPVPNPSRRRYLRKGAAVLAGAALLGIGSGAAVNALTTPTIASETLPKLKEGETTVLDELLKPLIEEARRRRAERAEADPNYYRRVDKELNEDRLNILLFMKGKFLRNG